MKKKFFLILSLFSLILFFTFNSFFKGAFPYTHDGENHLARFANYKIALKEGQIPPRFAPNLMNHYGYPVFNYNYPLANIVSVPFSVLNIDYSTTFKIIVFISVLFGMLGVFEYIRKLDFNKKTAFFSSLVYLSSPYLVSNIFFRGSIGEIMAMSLFPWLLLIVEEIRSLESIKISFKNIFVFSLFMLAHNISVLFGISLLIIYAIVRLKSKKSYLNLFKVIAVSILSTLWFWLPAYFEKNLVVLSTATNQKEFVNHFITLNQIFFAKLSFGFSYLGSIDGLSFSMGLLQTISIFIVIAIILNKFILLKIKKQKTFTSKIVLPKIILTSIIFVLFLSLFQLKFTVSIWEIIPLANFIQFPWRLGVFSAIFILPIIAYVYKNSPKSVKIFLMTLLLFSFLNISKIKPVDRLYKTNIDYDAYPESTSTLNENLPKEFTYLNIGDWQPGATILNGSGTIITNRWSGTKRSYQLDIGEDSIITEPTMNFSGWETTVNGEKINYILNDDTQGRIAYKISSGVYKIETKFTQKTWARMIGNSISLVTILTIVFHQFILIKKKND